MSTGEEHVLVGMERAAQGVLAPPGRQGMPVYWYYDLWGRVQVYPQPDADWEVEIET